MNLAQIDNDLKQAMKEKNALVLSVMRQIKTAAKNEMIDKRAATLSDEELAAIVKRLVKQTNDALSDFEKAQRDDLAKTARAELDVLQRYVPPQMTDEELAALIARKKEETGASDPSSMGKLMGAVMAEVAGRADGGRVKTAVQQALQPH